MSGNYASAGISINYNGMDISSGFQSANVSKNGDLQEVSFDLKGRMTISQLADQGGTIEIEYTQTDESLKKLDKMGAGVMLVSEFFEIPFQGLMTFKDPTGNTGSFVAFNTVITSLGDESWGNVVGTRTVSFKCERLIRTDNPLDVLANITQYLA